jgi:hypothetical protein
VLRLLASSSGDDCTANYGQARNARHDPEREAGRPAEHGNRIGTPRHGGGAHARRRPRRDLVGAHRRRTIALAGDADILVHQVADLAYLKRHGAGRAELERMAASLTDVTQVGNVAERARVGELILSHYLPAEPDAISDAEWAERAGHGYSGTTTAGTDGLRRALPRAMS